MSKDSNYVCTLDYAAVKKAKEELNEIPEDRLAAVEALREWIITQSHIKCPDTSTAFLLRFLRGAKFSQIRAREKLEYHLAMADKAPRWFGNVDSTDPILIKFFKSGYSMFLPGRTPNGCGIFLLNMGMLSKMAWDENDRLKAFFMLSDIMSRSEHTQVNGFVLILDFSGVPATFLPKLMTKGTKSFRQTWIQGMPGRVKAIHFYQSGVLFETILEYVKPLHTSKLVKRLKCHDTMESMYRDIPMEYLPIEYLPDDYTGPNAGTIQQITENNIAALAETSYRDSLLYRTSSAFGIDESKRPPTVTDHFRKLHVE